MAKSARYQRTIKAAAKPGRFKKEVYAKAVQVAMDSRKTSKKK